MPLELATDLAQLALYDIVIFAGPPPPPPPPPSSTSRHTMVAYTRTLARMPPI